MRPKLCALGVALAVVTFCACNVNLQKGGNGQNKKLDLKTPFGEIHVDNGADVRDTGLPVYAGARPKPKKQEGDEKSANVNISTSAFGLKVVAVEYESDDPPAKVAAFYQDELRKYGRVLECHSWQRHNWGPGHDHGSEELKCEGDNRGNSIELKAGTRSNQHIVAINPQGNGSDFALVYVRTHGKDDTI